MRTDFIDETGVDGKLRVFSLYADFAASGRAKQIAGAITRRAGPQWQCSSEMWKPEALTASEPIRRMISDDAVNSDVLIVAISSLEQRPVELIGWLDSLAALKPRHSALQLLVGLLGDEEDRPRELNWTVKQLMRCAQVTNRDFIWRWMESETMSDLGWLNENVERLLGRKLSLLEQMISQETAAGVGETSAIPFLSPNLNTRTLDLTGG